MQTESLYNFIPRCTKCGSFNVISRGEENRYQCKAINPTTREACKYRFRHKPSELSGEVVKVVEVFFDSGASITRALKNLAKMGIHLSEDQLRHMITKVGNNCRSTLEIAEEAGIKRGILLVDGTVFKTRGDEIPVLLAVDVKVNGGRAPIIVNDAFAREELRDTIPFIREIARLGYRPNPFVILDDTPVFENPVKQHFGDSIQTCPIHFGRNVLEAKLPSDLECTDFQLAVKWLVTRVLFIKANSTKRYAKALEKTKKYRDKLREMLRKADQQSASVISSFLQRFNQLILHLHYRTRYCDTNPLDTVVRLVKKPIRHGIRHLEDKEFVRAIVRLSMMRYDAGVLKVKDWVRWSQKREIGKAKPRTGGKTS